MRVVIYVRVSTDTQAEEGYSLDAQVERCKAYAISQGWEVVEVYIEEGESAKDLNRTELKRLLSDAGTGSFDVLLVYRLDRLTRSVRDLHNLLDMFEKHNIKFRSATEVYDTTTAMGKLFITIVAALAEWERGNLSERVRFGMEQLVNEGKWPGGVVPYGYEWDGQTMHIIPEEYTILRELRRLYMAGNGLRNTALHLNTKGMVRREGKVWTATIVAYTLENPFLAGKIRYGTKDKDGKYPMLKRADRVEVMMTDSVFPTIYTWEEYQEHTTRMKKREKYGNSRRNDYWFVGILRCARCGSKLKSNTYTNRKKDGTKYEPMRYYRCYSRVNGGGCNLPMLRQPAAEDMILEHIKSISVSHDEVAVAKESKQHDDRNRESELETLQKQLNTITERRRKWQYMFAEDLMSEKDFRARKREDDEQEKIILVAIEEVKSSAVGTSAEVMSYILDLPSLWNELSDAERKEWMQTIFESVYFDCDQETGEGAHRGKTLPFRITEINFN